MHANTRQQQPDSFSVTHTHMASSICSGVLLHKIYTPQDMQDPEMMREAQKMMQSPEFQAYMKKMQETPQFQQTIQRTQTLMKDPEKLKEMEDQVKKAVEQGTKELEQLEKQIAAKNGTEIEKVPAAAAATTDEEEDDLKVPNINLC
jgi:protein subunit release factor A